MIRHAFGWIIVDFCLIVDLIAPTARQEVLGGPRRASRKVTKSKSKSNQNQIKILIESLEIPRKILIATGRRS